MNELTKTLMFVGAAALATGVAVGTRSGSPSASAPVEISQPLFSEFKDPATAGSLKIVRFDESLASIKEIEVTKNKGLWTLPSHDGYPADAENRIRDAATAFIDLKPVSLKSDKDGEHALFGVLEPNIDKSSVGDQGVGTLVNIKDDSGNNLVNLIIGKEVKDQPDLRYVRRPGQSVVFEAKVDPKNLPVKFEDWIEKDLLKLNNWDISELVLKDYSFQVAASLSGPVTDYDQRLEMKLGEENGVWKLTELLVSDGRELKATELKETEQLNQQRLTALREALDTLEIVDVDRKPENLKEDLKADDGFASDQAGVSSLIQHGFYPVQMPSGEIEVLSADGEVLVHTKEGVEYVLRFGKVEGVDTEGGEGKLNRYLLVSARVNNAMFPEPDLEAVPETIQDLENPDPAPAPSADPSGDATSTGDATSAVPAGGLTETLPVAAPQDAAPDAPAETTKAPAVDTATAADGEATTETTAESPATTAESEPAPGDAGAAENVDTAAAPEAESAQDGGTAAEAAPESTAAPPASATAEEQAPALTEEQLKAELQRERERITKENQRKIDERNDKLGKAQKKVQELNYRFADWYYVISEDVYKKIHLGQVDLIEEKKDEAPPQSGFSPDALRGLEGQLPGQFPGQ